MVVNNWVVLLRKMPSLLFGLFLFAMGVVANLYSDLGMSPWGVLSVGIAGRTPLTIGQASQVVGFVVLAIGWLLGYVPGLGTVANMYFIGLFVDVIMAWGLLPLPSDDVGRFMMLFFSVVLIGVASYFYLRVRLGAGPRDGLMMGLMRRLNRPASTIRGTIEVTVLVAGYLLGGPVGHWDGGKRVHPRLLRTARLQNWEIRSEECRSGQPIEAHPVLIRRRLLIIEAEKGAMARSVGNYCS